MTAAVNMSKRRTTTVGMAREGRGEINLALENYNTALTFNPNFSPAREAKERLLAGGG